MFGCVTTHKGEGSVRRVGEVEPPLSEVVGFLRSIPLYVGSGQSLALTFQHRDSNLGEMSISPQPRLHLADGG